MDLTRHLHTFGHYLKTRFGEKVHKLSLAGDFTCPNRDGTLDRGGCTFCNVKSFGREGGTLSIAEQIALACGGTGDGGRDVGGAVFEPAGAPAEPVVERGIHLAAQAAFVFGARSGKIRPCDLPG